MKEIVIFGPTINDRSVSMRIYADLIYQSLSKSKGYNFRVETVNDIKTPIIKNWLFKDIYYPIKAGLIKSDVYHITDQSYGLLTSFLPKNKTVVTCHDLIPLQYQPQSSFLGRKRYLLNINSMLRANEIITVSRSTKVAIEKIFGYKGNISVVHNGVSTVFQELEPDSKNFMRSKLNLDKNQKYLLHIGGSYPVKNVTQILQALPHLINFKLIKVGYFTNSERNFIDQKKLSDRIINIPYLPIDDLVGLYNLADIFVFPSHLEGFGMPVIEAMACGCPVVCSNSSSLPEIGGDAALYTDPKSVESFIKSIDMIDKNQELKKSMIKKGLIQSKKFSWDKTARDLIDVYQRIAKS